MSMDCRNCGADEGTKPFHEVRFRPSMLVSCLCQECWGRLGVESRVSAHATMMHYWREDWEEIEAEIRRTSAQTWECKKTDYGWSIMTDAGVEITITDQSGDSELSHQAGCLASLISRLPHVRFEIVDSKAEIKRMQERVHDAVKDSREVQRSMLQRISIMKGEG